MVPESAALLDIEGVTGSIPVTPTIAIHFRSPEVVPARPFFAVSLGTCWQIAIFAPR
jgi:hypothetical protein